MNQSQEYAERVDYILQNANEVTSGFIEDCIQHAKELSNDETICTVGKIETKLIDDSGKPALVTSVHFEYTSKHSDEVREHRWDGNVENLKKERVWMKSGAYLVIEQTEAMVVIDVNTGKSVDKHSFEEHLLRINSEAAVEVCRQLRLRNLSGIIVVDFINMKQPGSMDVIKDILEQELAKDSVTAAFVDVTKLSLVELTRKKIRKSLKEQLTK